MIKVILFCITLNTGETSCMNEVTFNAFLKEYPTLEFKLHIVESYEESI